MKDSPTCGGQQVAEPTLSIGRPELLAEVGDFVGIGRDSTAWSTIDGNRIAEAIESGLRRFYYPDPLPQEEHTHIWSFMEPEATLTTVAATQDYTLPDNFGGFVGSELSFPDDEGYTPIKIKPIGHMQRLRQSASSGTPHTAAIRAKASDGTAGQRWEILLYPNPDDAWILQYHYTINPEAVTSGAPYPLGGPGQAEVLMLCCKWAADEFFNGGGDGRMEDRAMRKLVSAVQQDRTRHSPDYFGMVGDGDPGIPYTRVQVVTVDGSTPV